VKAESRYLSIRSPLAAVVIPRSVEAWAWWPGGRIRLTLPNPHECTARLHSPGGISAGAPGANGPGSFLDSDWSANRWQPGVVEV